MINWIKNLFKEKPAFLVTEYHPELEYTEEKYKKCLEIKDIEEKELEEGLVKHVSEPILSFIQCVKDNPRRFRCNIKRSYADYEETSHYFITDRYLKKQYSIKTYQWFGIYGTSETHYSPMTPDWITKEEANYLFLELSPIFKNMNIERSNKVKEWKRNKYIEIYCK